MEELRLKKSDKGFFSGSQEFIIMDICHDWHIPYQEFTNWPPDEQARYLAYYETKQQMQRWYEQLAEEEAKK